MTWFVVSHLNSITTRNPEYTQFTKSRSPTRMKQWFQIQYTQLSKTLLWGNLKQTLECFYFHIFIHFSVLTVNTNFPSEMLHNFALTLILLSVCVHMSSDLTGIKKKKKTFPHFGTLKMLQGLWHNFTYFKKVPLRREKVHVG